MIVTATFTGANGSMGYETGKEYRLKLIFPTSQKILLKALRLDGNDKMVSESACPYESVSAFLNNWKNVSKN